MEKSCQVLELFELEFSDMILLSSSSADYTSSCSSEEIQRLQWITDEVMENLGPAGPGLIAIKSVPAVSDLRRCLLPLARKLALLNHDDRNCILKEHSLGSDVPLKDLDRKVSSFAMQLKYDKSGLENPEAGLENTSRDDVEQEFKNLGRAFKKLGFLMMKIGLCIARICDRVISGQELEASLLESCSAKGRLIHYHSVIDNAIIRDTAQRKGRAKGNSKFQTSNGAKKSKQVECSELVALEKKDDAKLSCNSKHNQTDLWQQWHYDYGIFTVLTAPMFMLSMLCDHQECPYPDDLTYLQIFHPERYNVFTVKTSPESLIVQVGESADVLSKGKLRSTLHCVCRPQEMENVSRETFVVFLQPSWNKTFSLADYPVGTSTSGCQQSFLSADENATQTKQDLKELFQGIHSVVPPLLSRMRDGMTFAEFSQETTKQYYGASGLQSKR